MGMRRFALCVGLTVVLALGLPAVATSGSSVTSKFLTLPFPIAAGMRIQQAWLWTGGGHADKHRGLDYIYGKIDRAWTWKSFPVIAAADGKACAQLKGKHGCVEGIGNRVFIKHRVDGKVFYTYYGHLRWIDPQIPRGSLEDTIKVTRGQLLGYAGHSGDPPGVIHLHFELRNSHRYHRDPYDLYQARQAYPDPAGKNHRQAGPNHYWMTDPPASPEPPDGREPGTGPDALAVIRSPRIARLWRRSRWVPRVTRLAKSRW